MGIALILGHGGQRLAVIEPAGEVQNPRVHGGPDNALSPGIDGVGFIAAHDPDLSRRFHIFAEPERAEEGPGHNGIRGFGDGFALVPALFGKGQSEIGQGNAPAHPQQPVGQKAQFFRQAEARGLRETQD